MREFLRTGSTLVLAGIIAVLPGWVGGLRAQETVRLGNLKLAHFAAISYIKTIAPKCGLNVEEQVFAKGTDIMQGILAGALDVGATGSEAAISARGNGAPIFIVGGFARGGARLLAAPEAAIKSVADLKGKKVGVTRGGIQEVLLAAVLGEAGLSSSEQPGKDVQLLHLNYPDLNQALLQKQVDAIMQTEPQSSQAMARGFGVEVMKPYETAIGSPLRTLVMSEKFYNDNMPLAAKFLACFVTAEKTFIEHPEIAEQFVTQVVFKGQLTGDEFKAAIGNAPYSLEMSADHIQKTTDVMTKYGVGKMAKPPVASEWVKLDLLDAAKAAAGVK